MQKLSILEVRKNKLLFFSVVGNRGKREDRKGGREIVRERGGGKIYDLESKKSPQGNENEKEWLN